VGGGGDVAVEITTEERLSSGLVANKYNQ